MNSQKFEVIQILDEYEDQRKQIIGGRYAQLEDVFKRFEDLKQHIMENIMKIDLDNQERARNTQCLADIANEFYKRMQKMIKKF
ncbi:unnamed protein product [Blepharisma stoltei]|uniref:Uncharacterized protein n=1 Tax=Blepharisma stoltei TaxID=1481888 RepID=A0AAU9JB90_9CILI|nr:unnamed protein product [Blepharisma stoltei]